LRCSIALLSICALFAAAVPASAQSTPLPSRPLTLSSTPATLSADEARELEAWVREMARWEKTDNRWHNEPAPDPFGPQLLKAHSVGGWRLESLATASLCS